jgi:hypothetical protein
MVSFHKGCLVHAGAARLHNCELCEVDSRPPDAQETRHLKLQFIAPGKPIQNAHIESFNARLREECFNEHVFLSLDDARSKVERWRIAYNRERPHSSLGNLTPEEFAATAKLEGSSAAARTAQPAQEPLANAVLGAAASEPKPNRFPATLRL